MFRPSVVTMNSGELRSGLNLRDIAGKRLLFAAEEK